MYTYKSILDTIGILVYDIGFLVYACQVEACYTLFTSLS